MIVVMELAPSKEDVVVVAMSKREWEALQKLQKLMDKPAATGKKQPH